MFNFTSGGSTAPNCHLEKTKYNFLSVLSSWSPHGGEQVGPVAEVGQHAPLVPLYGRVSQGDARTYRPSLRHLGPDSKQGINYDEPQV